MADVQSTIDALLTERRVFEPSGQFREGAVWNDPAVYERAAADPEGFWAEQARSLDWFEPWDRVMEWKPPWVEWFLGGKLNVSYNCLDRHLERGGDKVAYYWAGAPGDARTLTYPQLREDV